MLYPTGLAALTFNATATQLGIDWLTDCLRTVESRSSDSSHLLPIDESGAVPTWTPDALRLVNRKLISPHRGGVAQVNVRGAGAHGTAQNGVRQPMAPRYWRVLRDPWLTTAT